jgi:hypothetical protein
MTGLFGRWGLRFGGESRQTSAHNLTRVFVIASVAKQSFSISGHPLALVSDFWGFLSVVGQEFDLHLSDRYSPES